MLHPHVPDEAGGEPVGSPVQLEKLLVPFSCGNPTFAVSSRDQAFRTLTLGGKDLHRGAGIDQLLPRILYHLKIPSINILGSAQTLQIQEQIK